MESVSRIVQEHRVELRAERTVRCGSAISAAIGGMEASGQTSARGETEGGGRCLSSTIYSAGMP